MGPIHPFVSFLIGVCVGIALMYWLFPDRGAEGDEDQGLDGK